mgnify:CR=1 FL=1
MHFNFTNSSHFGSQHIDKNLSTGAMMLLDKYVRTFDFILLDAPCSGNFCIEPNYFVERNLIDIKERAKVQKDLLKTAYKILKPGATMVYSTCSLEPEENEENVTWILNEFEDLNAVVVGQKNKDKSIDGILDKPDKEAKTFNTTFRETLDLLSEYEKLQNKLQNTEIELNLITTQTNIDDSLRLAISKATDSGLTKNTFASKNVKDETGKSTTTTKNTTDNQDIEQVEKIILSKKEEKDKLAKINNDYSIKEIDRIVSDYKREEQLKDENEFLTLKKQKKLNQNTKEGKKALAEIEKNYLVIQKQTADNVKVKEGDAIIEKQNIDVEFKKTQLQNTNEYYKDLEDANNAYNDALEKNAESSNEKAIAKQLKKQEREKNLLKGLISLTKLSADYFIRQSERKIEQIDKENNALEHPLAHCLEWFESVEQSWNKASISEGRTYQCVTTCNRNTI